MANARELLKRRKSAQNTRKITRTMELVASAKLRKAQNAAEASRPYAEGLAAMVRRLAAAGGADDPHPLMVERRPEKVTLMVACSDRGLCGAFNANLIKLAISRYRAHREEGRDVEVVTLGKKAVSTLRFSGIGMAKNHSGIMDAPKYDQGQEVIEPIIEDFAHRRRDLVEVVYSRFESAARSHPDRLSLLPAGGGGLEDAAEAGPGGDFIYHPPPAELLASLIPQTVKTAFYSCLLQTSAGEHAARRVAMKNATDAAGDLIKALSRQYNRARQTKITQEIAEIVGAVEAMA